MEAKNNSLKIQINKNPAGCMHLLNGLESTNTLQSMYFETSSSPEQQNYLNYF